MEIEEVRVGPHKDRRVEYDSKHNPSRGGRETKKRFKRRSAISFETRYNTSNTWLVFVARSFHSLLVVWRRDLPNHGGGSV